MDAFNRCQNRKRMPTYVYECSSCNKQFEIDQRITENALETCLCGSNGTVKRIIQPIAVMFKGSGFHINDYKSSGAPAKSESKTETKSDSVSTPAESPTVAESTPAPVTPST